MCVAGEQKCVFQTTTTTYVFQVYACVCSRNTCLLSDEHACVCVYVFRVCVIYIHTYIYMCMCVFACAHMCVHACAHNVCPRVHNMCHVYTCVFLADTCMCSRRTHVCYQMNTCLLCTHMCVHVYAYVCSMCTHLCVHVHTHVCPNWTRVCVSGEYMFASR